MRNRAEFRPVRRCFSERCTEIFPFCAVSILSYTSLLPRVTAHPKQKNQIRKTADTHTHTEDTHQKQDESAKAKKGCSKKRTRGKNQIGALSGEVFCWEAVRVCSVPKDDIGPYSKAEYPLLLHPLSPAKTDGRSMLLKERIRA